MGNEWLVILGVILIIFLCGKKLPEVGRGMGRFFVELKSGMKETESEAKPGESTAPKPVEKKSPTTQNPAKLT